MCLFKKVERIEAQKKDLDKELKGLEYQPLVIISNEFWVPTDEQLEEPKEEPMMYVEARWKGA
jgi:hypothetical protein